MLLDCGAYMWIYIHIYVDLYNFVASQIPHIYIYSQFVKDGYGRASMVCITSRVHVLLIINFMRRICEYIAISAYIVLLARDALHNA